MRKLAVLMLPALAAVGIGVVPAAHATTTVHLDVSIATVVPQASCDVSVPDNANGVAVLDAAVASGCIDSYEVREDGFLTCINQLCGAPDEALNITYWAIYVDGAYASKGIRDLTFPTDGTTLGLSYETWVTGFVPAP